LHIRYRACCVGGIHRFSSPEPLPGFVVEDNFYCLVLFFTRELLLMDTNNGIYSIAPP
jgi:hypothetical protein